MDLTIANIMLLRKDLINMFHVLFENKIYLVSDITEMYYISYDNEGNRIWLSKEDCEVI